jgi:cell division protein ZapB
MISEFQDLSDKIDRLAQLTQSLRAENYLLRQANTLLSAENLAFKERLIEAQRRVEALLDDLPKPPGEPEAEGEGDTAAAPAPAEPAAPVPPHLAHANRQESR